MTTYYVYEHWRMDRDECFYVGKGKGGRAHDRNNRNTHWNNIVAKLERIGSGYEVRLVAVGLSEKEAFELEKARIARWRDVSDLANMTDGGEGMSGYKMPEKTRVKISVAMKGKVPNRKGAKHTAQAKAKMSKAKKGRSLSEEHRKKLSAAMKGENHPFYGKNHTEHAKAKISATKRAKLGEAK